jgi:hypothetical protein
MVSRIELQVFREKSVFRRQYHMNGGEHQFNGPHFVISTDGNIQGEDTPENRDIARRIHACVNACDGISTEELESGVVREMRNMIAELVPVLQAQQQSRRQPGSSGRKITVTNDGAR